MKKLTSLFLALVLVLALCACGGKSGNPRAGVYKATSMTSEGVDLIQLMQGIGEEFSAYLVLNEDGTGRMELPDEDATELKWDDTNISSADGSDPMAYTFSDGTITLEEDGMSMVFQKLTGDELAAYQKNAG